MRVRCSEVIIRGQLTSMGVHPPCPSSPLLARPHVYSSPLQSNGVARQLSGTGEIGAGRPSRLAHSCRPKVQ